MFIRKDSHKKSGKEYITYKLVESTRTEKGPRQITLLNLGVDFSVPQSSWKDLCHLIEQSLRDSVQLSFFPGNPELARTAEKLAQQIINRKLKGSFKDIPDIDPFVEVDPKSLKNSQVRTVGGESICLDMIRQLDLEKKLLELGFNNKQLGLALGTIIGRLLSPGSDRSTFWWLQNQSALGELIGFDFNKTSLNRFYEVADLLLTKKKKIESFLYKKERDLFCTRESILLYDLTNTFFEGSGKYNDKAKRGRSKEKRSDAPLVTMGLVIDADGFPLRSEILDGNVSEPSTLSFMLGKLTPKQVSIEKATVVLDAGIATAANLEWLNSHHYDYIVVSRNKPFMPEEGEFEVIRDDPDNQVKVKLFKSVETDGWELYCHSTKREQKENAIKTLFQQRLEDELKKVDKALHSKNGTKKYDKVLQRVGRLKERYKKVAGLYQIEVKPDQDRNKAISVEWTINKDKESKKLTGVYCLKTNKEEANARELWETYIMLTKIEAAFLSMKSTLGLRPVYHQKERRVDAHLFVTLLAYHVMHSINFRLRKAGLNLN